MPRECLAIYELINKAFSPRVELVYQPAPWLSFYGNYTTAFSANNALLLSTHEAVPPQKACDGKAASKPSSSTRA
jgi:outer membrane receptor protein involved in Fe transport